MPSSALAVLPAERLVAAGQDIFGAVRIERRSRADRRRHLVARADIGPVSGEDVVGPPAEQQVVTAGRTARRSPRRSPRRRTGGSQPPCAKPPVGSSVGPPGACITPSSETNARAADLTHRRFRPRRAASIVATSIFCIVIIASNARLATAGSGLVIAFEQDARRDLPGKAPAVLAPAAFAFRAAIADDRVPVAVGLGLVLGDDHEADRFVGLEIRAAVEADEGAAEDGELDRQLVALLAAGIVARRASSPRRRGCRGRSRRRIRPPCAPRHGRTTGSW